MVRYLLTISFLFIQLFAASFGAEAKGRPLPAKEVTVPIAASLQSSDVAWADAFLADHSFKVSPSRNQQSFPQQAVGKFVAAGSFAAASLWAQNWFFKNNKPADIHTPLALLLLFPKHYFW